MVHQVIKSVMRRVSWGQLTCSVPVTECRSPRIAGIKHHLQSLLESCHCLDITGILNCSQAISVIWVGNFSSSVS